MITLYTWKTADGRKPAIMLEEIGADYEIKLVNLRRKEQFEPDYLKISPNNKIPAIVDNEGPNAPRVLFESGAILLYLAEKSGRLLPASGPRRDEALKWLFWSSTAVAPMVGQWNYFTKRAEHNVPAAIERFTNEVVRLFKVLEKRLGEQPYLAQDYSIADIGAYTRINSALDALRSQAGAQLGATPGIERWLSDIASRPAVKRGLEPLKS